MSISRAYMSTKSIHWNLYLVCSDVECLPTTCIFVDKLYLSETMCLTYFLGDIFRVLKCFIYTHEYSICTYGGGIE